MPNSPFPPAPGGRAAPEVIQEQSRLIESIAPVLKILNAVPMMSMVLNRQRQIVALNQHLLEFLDVIGAEEVLGLRLGEVFECKNAAEAENGCGTGRLCALCGALEGILSSQAGRASTQICRLRRQTAAGEEGAHLEVCATPLAIGGEQFTIVFASDIGDRVRGEFLEHAILPDVLARAAEIEALAIGLAGPNAPGLRERTAIALLATASRLAATLQNYSDLTLAEAGELGVVLRNASALEAIRDAAAGFKFDEAAEGRQLHIAPEAEDAELLTDPAQLRRILHRMVLNALEASPPDSVVTLGCRRAGERAELSVQNDGVMPMVVQLQVFQRGYSTKGLGRGFGVYLMRLIAERFLDGTVSFRSNPQEGTTFVLSLPLASSPMPEAAA